MVFHLWPDVAPGGFVGVSLFFTISGFVIVRGVHAEIERSHRFQIGQFWGRRIRRVWPASAVTLAVVVAGWALAGWLTPSIAKDVGASFAQVANWRFIATGTAYGVSTDTSPVAHFWSLAIEEQFYLVVPLLVLAFRRIRGGLVVLFLGLVATSVVTTAMNSGDSTVVYYSTFTRIAEIAAGGLLALAVARISIRPAVDWRARGVLAVLAVVGIGGLVAASRFTSLGTEAYYSGALTGLALLSVAAIVAAIWHHPTRRALSIRPLVWLGGVSYAVYLFHWPIGLAMDQAAVPAWSRPWITLVLTLVAAAVSLRLLEQPIRLRRYSQWITLPSAAGLTVVIVAVCLVGARSTPPASAGDFFADQGAFDQFTAEAVARDSTAVTVPDAPKGTAENPVRVATFGDSTALRLGLGLGGGDPTIRNLGGGAVLACPIGRGGSMRGGAKVGNSSRSPSLDVHPLCDWTTRWPDSVRATDGLDVAVVLGGNWDISGRKVPALGSWMTVGDPAYDSWLRSEMGAAADALHDAGATKVVWLTLPAEEGTSQNPRAEGFNELLVEVAADRPWLIVADYAGFLASQEHNRDWRPDGVHLSSDSPDSGAEVVSRLWLNDVLRQAALS